MINHLSIKSNFSGSPPMLILGPVVFHLKTAAYQTFQRSTSFNWATLQRLNTGSKLLLKNLTANGPAAQYINIGDDKIHLEGVIYLQIASSIFYMSFMRSIASLGTPLPLLSCDGSIAGLWIIERIDQTNSIFATRGAPRKVEFKLDLKRYNSDSAILNVLGAI
ncbi:MAG: phage tail protein [Rickettsia endosymbiont of Ixodes persulcatus]|nr:phage tail protein [Rickettsia endosymbiont of Ixodes persulcatus]